MKRRVMNKSVTPVINEPICGYSKKLEDLMNNLQIQQMVLSQSDKTSNFDLNILVNHLQNFNLKNNINSDTFMLNE